MCATRKALSSPSFPVVSGKHLGLNVQFQRAEAFHMRFRCWRLLALLRGFAHFLCKQQKCLHLHRELGLRPLEAGGKTHHGTGLPQGATILRPWACSCRGRKQGDTAGTRAVELQGLGHFVIELSLLLPAAKQTNRKDISLEREKVFDLDCAV